MKLSIIIPTLNEETIVKKNLSLISRQLSAISNELSTEIIIADGGSSDRTVEVAKRFADKVCISYTGRGIQMNTGAKASEGDLLLFLHADSLFSVSGIQSMLEVMQDDRVTGGAFKLKIDSTDSTGLRNNRVSLKTISSFANIRSKIFNIVYGDQGIFVRRDIFYKIGGYPEIPIMEDVEFVITLKKFGKFIILPEYITTSSRRWDSEGIFYCSLRNWVLISLYLTGVSPYKLNGWYREHGG